MLLLLLYCITASATLVLHHGFCCTVLHHCLCYTGSAPRLLLHWVLGLQSSTLLPDLQASTLPSGIQASTLIFKHQHCYRSSKHHHCSRSSCVITAFLDLQVSSLLPDLQVSSLLSGLQVSPLLPLHCIGHCLFHWIYTSSEVPTNLSLYQRKSPHHTRCVILLASSLLAGSGWPIHTWTIQSIGWGSHLASSLLARSGWPIHTWIIQSIGRGSYLARLLLQGQVDLYPFSKITLARSGRPTSF